MKLLVVEDDRTVGHYVKRGLEEAQYIADWAMDGAVALEMLQATAYDLVVLDLRLPGMTGLEVLRTVRDRGQTMPILVLTALALQGEAEEVLASGCCDAFMTKPAPLASIESKVAELLEGRTKAA